ncbi:MAG: tRNA-dihydrouridine synthase family protein [Lachnospiraceae bacterium]|nr:tRNA-dihydrouridine synthase family protein [Lachnospiraceae bacterium]
MKIYMAPLEGITGFLYRNAQRELFGGADKYFAPFIDAALKRSMKSKELRDILPENNVGANLVPQIMTNDAEAFKKTLEEMGRFGYQEINLNLGCPSGTVVAKGRGSGFLAQPQKLERFLDSVFASSNVQISIKTRIGVDDPEEMEELLRIYNRFPLKELIVHPRIQQDFYKNTPNLEVFAEVLENSVNPVCYNGDLFSEADYAKFVERFPTVETVMLGRGLLSDPALVRKIRGGKPMEVEEMRALHDRMYESYKEYMSGEMPVLHKMKELWFYWIQNFADNEKLFKKMKKAKHLREYESAVQAIFQGGFVVR